MLERISQAFDRQDYKTAARLVRELLAESPNHPWGLFYLARLREISGRMDEAEKIYRHLIREATHPKLITQVKHRLQQLATSASSPSSNSPLPFASNSSQPSVAPIDPKRNLAYLVLEAPENRAAAVQGIAQVMKLDAYTARMRLPSRGWRLHRVGSVADIQAYGETLQAAHVPCQWITLSDLDTIRVFQVDYFQNFTDQPMIVCQDESGQVGAIAFEWSEVTYIVEGMLPIFEQVVDVGYRDVLERKEAIQDYARVCDLHLRDRTLILRLQDNRYDFHQGIAVIPPNAHIPMRDRTTIRTHWNTLIAQLKTHLPHVAVASEFTLFAESAEEFADSLTRVRSQIYLPRPDFTAWDPAFHLYSGLMFRHA